MFDIRTISANLPKIFLSLILCIGCVGAYAVSEAETKVAEEQKAVAEAQIAKDVAQKEHDALAAQQASKPSPDTERKLKDSEYEVMMANSKLSSANKALERAQKKLDDSSVGEKSAAKIEKPLAVSEQKAPAATVIVENKKVAEEQAHKDAEAKLAAQKATEEAAKKAAEEQARKDADAKAAAQKASEESAKKAAEEQARKEAEAKLAAQKASEEAARKAAEAEAATKKLALAAELGIDKNCIALPGAPTNPSATISASEQAYAQGFLKQVNQIVAKKAANDAPPISPFPVLEGSKLNPCDPNQKLGLKFGYMGNGQYRVETPVLAGEQIFSVKGVVQSLNRTIPDADNGEVYVFFLDAREGRTQLSAYKKSLLDQAPQP